MQNYAARVILRLPMSSSMTSYLKSLHWLPVKVRSTYKIACLCYHCLSSTAPSHVADMLQRMPSHTRITRSSSYTMPLLNTPAHSKAALGDRSFSFASVWDSISNDVRCAPSLSSSKSCLKTYLLRSVYKVWTLSLITEHMCMGWPCNSFVLPLIFANAFGFHALSWFIDTVCLFQVLFCIMRSGFNLLVFPNSMFTPFFI